MVWVGQAREAGLDTEAIGERLLEHKQALMEEFKYGAHAAPAAHAQLHLVQDHPVNAGSAI